MAIQLIDQFTTRNGQWNAGLGLEYGIPAAMLAKYGGWDIPGRSGEVHIFVYAPVGSIVTFDTVARDQKRSLTVPQSGWVNFPIGGQGSGYNPDAGHKGAWSVWVNGVLVGKEIGRPRGYHVSTFLIVADVADTTPAPAPYSGRIDRVVFQTLVVKDGVEIELVAEQILWQS